MILSKNGTLFYAGILLQQVSVAWSLSALALWLNMTVNMYLCECLYIYSAVFFRLNKQSRHKQTPSTESSNSLKG